MSRREMTFQCILDVIGISKKLSTPAIQELGECMISIRKASLRRFYLVIGAVLEFGFLFCPNNKVYPVVQISKPDYLTAYG
ncbi:hypothetical protein NC652_029280 [Populus alba x Populus x berolinensis]|nr:hypothetical protein NC652_029280 [Populus alba x Populus x berolinensis]